MSQQIISTGSGPNTGTGDAGYSAFTKVNANFTELYGKAGAQNVSAYGVTGNGATDDTTAMQAAAAAGVDLFVPPGFNIKLTGAISFTAGQTLYGAGTGDCIVTPSGNFDVFSWSNGTAGGGLHHLRINASGMTGGNIVNVTNANRTSFQSLVITSPFNGFFLKKLNVCGIRDVWLNGATGTYCIQWVGDNSNRSDVLDIDNVQVSGNGSSSAASPVGLIMDGNVNTLDIRHFAATSCLQGIVVQNTAGGSAPQFLTGYDIQVDNPWNECIKIGGSAREILLTDIYMNGSKNADNLNIDSTVFQVNIQGGKSSGAWQRGGFLNGRYIQIANMQCYANSQAGSATWAGWEIGSSSTGVSIIGGLAGQAVGVASELQQYGVLIDASAISYRIIGVNLRNNVTGPYLDNAADSNSSIIGLATAGSSTANQLAGQLKIIGALGVNNTSPPAQSTGWGSPVGNAVINNYNITDAGGASSNTNKAVAQIIASLKAFGLFGA
jgi:hypothetical protein